MVERGQAGQLGRQFLYERCLPNAYHRHGLVFSHRLVLRRVATRRLWYRISCLFSFYGAYPPPCFNDIVKIIIFINCFTAQRTDDLKKYKTYEKRTY